MKGGDRFRDKRVQTNGNLTDSERRERVTDLWTDATERVADAMEQNFRRLNPVYMMATSGSRGSKEQIRQLAVAVNEMPSAAPLF